MGKSPPPSVLLPSPPGVRPLCARGQLHGGGLMEEGAGGEVSAACSLLKVDFVQLHAWGHGAVRKPEDGCGLTGERRMLAPPPGHPPPDAAGRAGYLLTLWLVLADPSLNPPPSAPPQQPQNEFPGAGVGTEATLSASRAQSER